jgi:zinc protease
VVAGVAPDKVEQAVEIIRAEILRMQDELVSEQELIENKTFFNGQLVLGLEMNEGVADSLVMMELYQLGLDYLHNYHALIDAITREQVQAAVQQYLSPDAYAIGIAGPPAP